MKRPQLPPKVRGIEALIEAHRRAYACYTSADDIERHARRARGDDEVVRCLAESTDSLMRRADNAFWKILTYRPRDLSEVAHIARHILAHWAVADPIGGDWMIVELAKRWAEYESPRLGAAA